MSGHLRPRSGAWLPPVRPLERWKRTIHLQGHRLCSPWVRFSKSPQTRQPPATTMKTMLSSLAPDLSSCLCIQLSAGCLPLQKPHSSVLDSAELMTPRHLPKLRLPTTAHLSEWCHPGLPRAKCPPWDDQGSVGSLSRTLPHSLTKCQVTLGFLH